MWNERMKRKDRKNVCYCRYLKVHQAQTTSLTYPQKQKNDHGTTLHCRLGECMGVVGVERHLLILGLRVFVGSFARQLAPAKTCCFGDFLICGERRKHQRRLKSKGACLTLQLACRLLESHNVVPSSLTVSVTVISMLVCWSSSSSCRYDFRC